MPRPSWGRTLARLTAAAVGALIAAAPALLAQPAAPPPPASAEGTLQVVWGDPGEALAGTRPDARPLHRFFLERAGAPPVEVGFAPGPVDGTSPVLLGGRQLQLQLGPGAAGTPAPVRAAALRDAGQRDVGGALPAGLRRSVGAAAPLARPVAVILCQFPDSTVANWKSRDAYERDWIGGTESVAAWYAEVSRDALSFTGTRAFGPYTLPRNRAEYLPNGNANLSRLADECTRAADPDVFFPEYWGVVLYFSAPLDCCSWGGSRTLSLDGQTRTYGMNWNASWAGLGTSVHELGHSLGLPHSSSTYGRVYDSRWDVMSGGGLTHFVAWGKQRMGYLPTDRQVVARGAARTVRIGRSAQPLPDGSALVVELPLASGPGHAYLLEVRRPVGLDATVPGDGVVITRVNPSRAEPAQVIDGDGNGNVNDAGAVWTPGERFYDPTAGIEVAVLSSDASGYTVVVRNGVVGGVVVDGTPRADTVAAGAGPSAPDSVRVRTATGGATGWVARAGAGWLQLTSATGTGDGVLRWRTTPAGLPLGTYTDTIRLSAVGSAAEAALPVTLTVTGTAPALGLVGRFSMDTAYAGILIPWRIDSARVVPGAAGAGWTVVRGSTTFAQGHLALLARTTTSGGGSSFATVQTVQGTGAGWIHFVRTRPSGPPAVGTLIDSLVVTTGTGVRLVVPDTVRVVPLPTLALARGGGADTLGVGGARRDSVRVSGSAPGPVRWTASSSGRVVRLDQQAFNPGGLGDGVVRFTRRTDARPPGTYVDTVTINLRDQTVLLSRYVDTTWVVDVPTLAMTLSAASRRAVVARGGEQSLDSVFVTLAGPGATAATWTIRSARGTAMLVGRGSPTPETGSGWLRWSRTVDGAADGLVVDTIEVRVGTATAAIVDSIQVERVLAMSAPLRAGTRGVATLTPVQPDSLAVRVEGRGGAAFPWRATTAAPWLTLAAAAGTGPGTIRLARTVAGLAPGTYADSIVITGGDASAPSARWVVRDTVQVLAVPAVAAAARDLLGGAGMTDVERQALDVAGNRDGVYNLGDLMAHADRTGTPIAAALLEPLLARAAVATPATPTARSPAAAAASGSTAAARTSSRERPHAP